MHTRMSERVRERLSGRATDCTNFPFLKSHFFMEKTSLSLAAWHGACLLLACARSQSLQYDEQETFLAM